MTDWMALFSNPKDIAFFAVAACALLVIGGHEAYRLLSGRGVRDEGSSPIIEAVAGVAVVFIVMSATVGRDIAAHAKPSFNPIPAVLAVVVLAVVAGLRWRFHRGLPQSDDAESRRTAAHDL
ncbi:MAG TPA: hypothetical protein VN932_00675 [Rhizomicrobium sp.]|nr:hypothetical protein [Rhizomicrobium sp.]